jgi:hypothetical protein
MTGVVLLSASRFETGLIMALGLLTPALLGPPMGVSTDPVRRRPLIGDGRSRHHLAGHVRDGACLLWTDGLLPASEEPAHD